MRPLHVPVIVGLSAGMYAGTLAICSLLQFDVDRQLVEDRRPVADAIAALGMHGEEMTARLRTATERYAAAADGYDEMTVDSARLRRQLDALARRVTAIDRIQLDTASLVGPAPVSRPWYGGGWTSSGSTGSTSRGSGGGTAPRAAPAPPPPAAAPPPKNGSTGASGAP
jgi:hypothetical protein